ncbi:uncharacterized protein LOC135471122 isoform X3 [Liolophura sinensis]|uniref:uncharacterized protein LOC135471122 isoform X3 n=1 Tax=Liolophura sinensis TaxID=3198878 RepID=UPI0031598EC0
MGVTLERVQFKFASIIGELCSEPDILSQFAVWVDLRIAEYKLKGSISLDCSGETPDPVWLKGIKSALLAKELALKSQPRTPSFNRRKATPHPLKPPLTRPATVTRDSGDEVHPVLSSTPINNRSSTSARLSPLVIKEEPDDVYPISLHVHNPDSRKHPYTVDSDTEQPQSAKRKRFEDTSPEDAPANESLMSIIGLNDTADKTDTVLTQEDSVSNEIDLLMAQELSEKARQDADVIAAEITEQSFSSLSTSSNLVSSRLGQGNNQNESCFTRGIPEHKAPQGEGRLSCIDRRLRSHVKVFERWLQCEPYCDFRPIEDIPPPELNNYLADFFPMVKTQSGEEFTPKSLCRLRSSLERYLRDQNYPESITHSDVFLSSKLAYKTKMSLLEHAALLNIATVGRVDTGNAVTSEAEPQTQTIAHIN